MPVNTNKFDSDFKNHPNFKQITEEINRSPLLVDLIDRFPGKIVIGKPGTGTFFSPQRQKIYIDRDWVNAISSTSESAYLSKFVTLIAHELGHAVIPFGSLPNQ